jgi:hypothetical protein
MLVFRMGIEAGAYSPPDYSICCGKWNDLCRAYLTCNEELSSRGKEIVTALLSSQRTIN